MARGIYTTLTDVTFTALYRNDQPPRVVPLIVLVWTPYLSPEVAPKGSTLPHGAGWRPAPVGAAPVSYVA